MQHTKITLSQEVTLKVGRGESAWVEMPFGIGSQVNIKQVERELAGYGLALIDPSEAEPEIISASALRVWCHSTTNE